MGSGCVPPIVADAPTHPVADTDTGTAYDASDGCNCTVMLASLFVRLSVCVHEPIVNVTLDGGVDGGLLRVAVTVYSPFDSDAVTVRYGWRTSSSF